MLPEARAIVERREIERYRDGWRIRMRIRPFLSLRISPTGNLQLPRIPRRVERPEDRLREDR